MRKWRALVLIALSLYQLSCTPKSVDDTTSDAEKRVNAIIVNTASQLTERYHMWVIGRSASMFQDVVSELGIEFQIQGPLTQDQLRPIMVDCVNELLTAINTNEQLRPYLKFHPFNEQNVDVVLFVVDKRKSGLTYPNISIVKLRDGDILYCAIDDNPQTPRFIYLARESFQSVATN